MSADQKTPEQGCKMYANQAIADISLAIYRLKGQRSARTTVLRELLAEAKAKLAAVDALL